jgi:hypothetical protein
MDALDLRKEKVLNLTKELGIGDQKFQVVIVMDRSGSMDDWYDNGLVQTIMDRVLPVALAMDDNESAEVYLFGTHFTKVGDLTRGNIPGYVKRSCNWEGGGTNYAPVLKQVIKDCLFEEVVEGKKPGFFGKLFGAEDTSTTKLVSKEPLKYPIFVIMFTDGDNYDHHETEQVIREASHHGLYFQFVGLGRQSFPFLERLDDLDGRKMDNAGFFKAADINAVDDKQLYDLLLKEIPDFLGACKRNKLIQ